MCAHLQLASQLLAAAVPVQCPELRLFAKGSLDVDAPAHNPHPRFTHSAAGLRCLMQAAQHSGKQRSKCC